MLFINSTANDFASSSWYIIIRMILGSGFKGINKIGKALAVRESRRRERETKWQTSKQGHFRQCFVHDVLEIDRVGGKGRPEWGMFKPFWKDGKALSLVVVVRSGDSWGKDKGPEIGTGLEYLRTREKPWVVGGKWVRMSLITWSWSGSQRWGHLGRCRPRGSARVLAGNEKHN